MKRILEERNISDYIKRVLAYAPQTLSEKQALQDFSTAYAQFGEQILLRSCEEGHVTCSGFVMNPELNKVLMAYHNIYDSYAWTGGHADGSNDFLWTAYREAKEETGIQHPVLPSGEILSVDTLPVKAHTKHGNPVKAHVHYNITYGIIAEEKETLQIKPDENSAVAWIPVTELETYCKEPHMLPIYQKLITRMQTLRIRQNQAIAQLRTPLLNWYSTHARVLPWRQDKNPYHVWISEIMLQQTRVEAVKSYYLRFLQRFPTIQDLASATQDEVNKYWEGLGYYNRAANLKKTAEKICADYQGQFPNSYDSIRLLPGIGAYTAGAIHSICFEQPTPAVDGNVTRVISRLTDCFCETDRRGYAEAVAIALQPLYNQGDCGLLTQSLMELGATVCLPNGTPLCEQCPASEFCFAKKNADENALPLRLPKRERKIQSLTVLILTCGDKIAVEKRTSKGLLQGLWQFPNLPKKLDPQVALDYLTQIGASPILLERTVERKHIFTHITWEMRGMYIQCNTLCDQFTWATLEEIHEKISLPTAFRQFLD